LQQQQQQQQYQACHVSQVTNWSPGGRLVAEKYFIYLYASIFFYF